ncbi:unnamed protein product [Cyprideis torosa]|uniref:Uncharacterized protein n=1 Tax=Cyprideis torosa TaxID=163714 RepID=A0A7R8ZID2_9CRUS|nr:unnamed protein product [Cyprideis torosa]CAG0885850.1 unnamed protein product [Cyprideis torosa]
MPVARAHVIAVVPMLFFMIMSSLASDSDTNVLSTSSNDGPVCLLPFDPGDCDGRIPVWAFVNFGVDNEGFPQLECVPRVYTGCGGNGNRFPTLQLCIEICY